MVNKLAIPYCNMRNKRLMIACLMILIVSLLYYAQFAVLKRSLSSSAILNKLFPETQKLVNYFQVSCKEKTCKDPPKIAFLFLTQGNMQFENLWKNWFAGHEDKYLLLIHCDKTSPSDTSEWINSHRTSETVPTAWGHANLTKAMILLLKEAVARDYNGRVAKAVFLSDTCVPLQTFNDCYQLLLADSLCWFHRTVDSLAKLSAYPKSSQWCALNREAMFILKNESVFDEYWRKVYERHVAEWNILTDEFYIVNVVVDNNLWVPLHNRTMTWFKWTTGGSSPNTFSSDVSFIRNTLYEAKRNGVLFARKFSGSSGYESLSLHNRTFFPKGISSGFFPRPYVADGLTVS